MGRVEAARPYHRRLRGGLRAGSLHLRILSRARSAARLSVGRADHGHVALRPTLPRRARVHRGGDAAQEPGMRTQEMPPLEAEIRRRIEQSGPLPVAHYMALCLTDPEHGYYTKRAPIGPDFLTAPEIS